MSTRTLALRARRPLYAVSMLGLAGAAAPACLNRPIDRLEPRTTTTVVEPLAHSRVDKLDILLAIDSSISMADKQTILSRAVPELVDRLISPQCVALDTGAPVGVPFDGVACPAGSEPEFEPLADIHVGIVTSSLGDLATGVCDVNYPDDKGRLVARLAGGAPAPTWQNRGFLAWDPGGAKGGESDADALGRAVGDMVVGVGQEGCGYEMPLESVVRFLVDPSPYESIVHAGGQGEWMEKVGVDQTVLAQRADFLRPDSLVAIIMLTDENDCSFDVGGQGHLLLGEAGPFYKATEECAMDPNDPCCTSCRLPNPEGCKPDPLTCGPGQGTLSAARYASGDDSIFHRCWDQKRRYGVDFLYPVERYKNALTELHIDPSRADLRVVNRDDAVPNPLFFGQKDGVTFPRPAGFVYFAGIVGVPWQAIARRDASGAPDLALGYKSVEELAAEGAFAKLAGDPDRFVPPTDPFMVESTAARSGTSDLVGASLPGENHINGGDRGLAVQDLQYACTFALPDPVPNGPDCDTCDTTPCDTPLCSGTTQIAAKAQPGLRQLALLRGLGEQGIVASICPEHLDEGGNPADYGYNPAVATLVERLKDDLRGKCIPIELTPDDEGNVPCLVIEASIGGGSCECPAEIGRAHIPPEIGGERNPAYNAVIAAQQRAFNPGWDCFCEIEQLRADARQTCQYDPSPEGVDGWCYLDANTVPQTGDPAIIADACSGSERRLIRFVGEGEPRSGATAVITCTGE